VSALDDNGVPVTEPATLRSAYHEAAHAIVAELLGVRVDVVSIRPGEHHRGVTIHASLAVDDIAEILARRHGTSLLARWGVKPYPFFDPEERRRAECSIMVALAGHLGEFLAPEPFTGFVEDTGADDHARAIAAAAELTAEQERWLADAEHTETLGDDDAAFEKARRIAGDEAAAAFVHFLTLETRRLMFSPLVRSLVPPVVDELLRYEAISGETVREIVSRVTGETPQHEEPTMVRAAAKQADPNIARIAATHRSVG
jgi:hypothetical protein